MTAISLQELQSDPDTLLDRVAAGEHLLVVRGGRPVAELRPVPFDRLLVAQALQHGLTLATVDPDIAAYPVPLLPEA
jgi:antitoxin (DNA-binding transcriptional repressor) of toxin-antitoxin stability system